MLKFLIWNGTNDLFKMKVLQICHKPPLPPNDGGCIAINNISKGLVKELGSIKVLTISTLKHPFNLKYYDKTLHHTMCALSAIISFSLCHDFFLSAIQFFPP